MNDKRKLNVPDTDLDGFLAILNIVALLSCWGAVILDILFFMITSRTITFILLSFLTPLRYFFFDIAPSKLAKRPPELDRIIPLTILVNYWNKKFPIPQGNFLADMVGILLASLRAWVNGYGLLFFDSFTFLYKKRNDKNGIPLNGKINKLSDSKRLNNLYDKNEKNMDKEVSFLIENRIAENIDIWNFPLRRYLSTQKEDSYFKANELGAKLIDDRYILDNQKYTQDHTSLKVRK